MTFTAETLKPFLGKEIEVTRNDGVSTRRGRLDCIYKAFIEIKDHNGTMWMVPITFINSLECEGIVYNASVAGTTPPHYAGTVTPWDLEKCMKSSGNAFVDARRTDAIEYCYRLKDDLLADLKKARHCLDEAIQVLEETI